MHADFRIFDAWAMAMFMYSLSTYYWITFEINVSEHANLGHIEMMSAICMDMQHRVWAGSGRAEVVS